MTYPNNPTGSTATKAVFDEAIQRFKGTHTKIVHDFAYSAFDLMQRTQVYSVSKDAKEVAIEIFHYLKVIICQDLE